MGNSGKVRSSHIFEQKKVVFSNLKHNLYKREYQHVLCLFWITVLTVIIVTVFLIHCFRNSQFIVSSHWGLMTYCCMFCRRYILEKLKKIRIDDLILLLTVKLSTESWLCESFCDGCPGVICLNQSILIIFSNCKKTIKLN